MPILQSRSIADIDDFDKLIAPFDELEIIFLEEDNWIDGSSNNPAMQSIAEFLRSIAS